MLDPYTLNISQNTGTLCHYGKCDAGMAASATSIVCADFIGWGDDYFNLKYYMQVTKNASAVGTAPENEIRQITDFATATGTFTVTAFSANVQENDEIAVFHETIVFSHKDRARLDLGWHQQAPLIETFRGYLDQDTRIAANSAITPTQVAEQCARYPGAAAWTYRGDGTCTVNVVQTSIPWFALASGGVNGNRTGLAALHPIYISTSSPYTLAFPNDERLVWECLIIPDATNNNGNVGWWFAGIANEGVEGNYATSEDDDKTAFANFFRIGFCTANAADKTAVGISCDGAAVSATAAFDMTAFNTACHLKFVFDIGTGVEFFHNGVSKGTIAANLASGQMIPFFLAHRITGTVTMYVYPMVRLYYQNGV